MIEPVGATSHQGHHQATSHKHSRRILVLLQATTDITQKWVVIKQSLYLVTPFPQPLVHRHLSLCRRRRRLRPFGNLCIRLARCLGDSILHGLTRLLAEVFLLPLSHALSGTGHGLLHVLVALVDDLLHPRLRFEHGQRLLLVAIEHDEQITGQFKTLVVAI